MGWCFDDEADPYTERVLGALEAGTAVVPALWPLEVANVLLVAERRRRLRRADVVQFLDLLEGLPVEVDPVIAVADVAGISALAREHRLSAYDAAYLHLAMRERLPLATRDAALRSAARAVSVAHFSA
jgi:predicted nucleic acid-binding protein